MYSQKLLESFIRAGSGARDQLSVAWSTEDGRGRTGSQLLRSWVHAIARISWAGGYGDGRPSPCGLGLNKAQADDVGAGSDVDLAQEICIVVFDVATVIDSVSGKFVGDVGGGSRDGFDNGSIAEDFVFEKILLAVLLLVLFGFHGRYLLLG